MADETKPPAPSETIHSWIGPNLQTVISQHTERDRSEFFPVLLSSL